MVIIALVFVAIVLCIILLLRRTPDMRKPPMGPGAKRSRVPEGQQQEPRAPGLD